MGFYEQQILPRIIDKMCGNANMAKIRRPSLAGLHGTIVEIGFGSGPNVPLYPDEVDKVFAVDPSIVGRKLAEKHLTGTTIPIEFVGLDGESLPLDDESVDGALSTWTLCTIPDVDAALREVRRVLKPEGQLFFLEHGLSDDPKLAKRQHQITPIQRRIAGGCHLDRDITSLVKSAGFRIDRVKNFTLAGPKSMGYMYSGVASKVGAASNQIE